jgi:hypothetical protein
MRRTIRQCSPAYKNYAFAPDGPWEVGARRATGSGHDRRAAGPATLRARLRCAIPGVGRRSGSRPAPSPASLSPPPSGPLSVEPRLAVAPGRQELWQGRTGGSRGKKRAPRPDCPKPLRPAHRANRSGRSGNLDTRPPLTAPRRREPRPLKTKSPSCKVRLSLSTPRIGGIFPACPVQSGH